MARLSSRPEAERPGARSSGGGGAGGTSLDVLLLTATTAAPRRPSPIDDGRGRGSSRVHGCPTHTGSGRDQDPDDPESRDRSVVLPVSDSEQEEGGEGDQRQRERVRRSRTSGASTYNATTPPRTRAVLGGRTISAVPAANHARADTQMTSRGPFRSDVDPEPLGTTSVVSVPTAVTKTRDLLKRAAQHHPEHQRERRGRDAGERQRGLDAEIDDVQPEDPRGEPEGPHGGEPQDAAHPLMGFRRAILRSRGRPLRAPPRRRARRPGTRRRDRSGCRENTEIVPATAAAAPTYPTTSINVSRRTESVARVCCRSSMLTSLGGSILAPPGARSSTRRCYQA